MKEISQKRVQERAICDRTYLRVKACDSFELFRKSALERVMSVTGFMPNLQECQLLFGKGRGTDRMLIQGSGRRKQDRVSSPLTTVNHDRKGLERQKESWSYSCSALSLDLKALVRNTAKKSLVVES